MRVSIVIPTFNRAVYLELAISSALAQDYPDLEVVVSDNASTDNTEQVVKAFSRDPRIKYFKNADNIGMVGNWRQAVFERTSGDWFLILSDDDILTNPKFISQAVEIIRSTPNVTVVYSDSYVYDEALNTVTKLNIPFARVEDGLRVFASRGTVHPQDFALCNVLFNKRLSKEANAFHNIYNVSCDTELFLRLCIQGNVGIVKEYSSIYRVHSGNLLKSVSKNTDYVIGSLDSLIEPLQMAEKQQIDPEVIRQFVGNSGLKKEILVCLLKVTTISKEKANELYLSLQSRVKESRFNILPSKVLFKFITMVASVLTPLFSLRRRSIYTLKAAKRMFFGKLVFFEPLKKKVYFIE